MAQIVLFLDSLATGGAERVMVTLANSFAKRGHTVSVVLIRPIADYASELDSAVQLVHLNAKRMSLGGIRFTQYLRRCQPSAILSTITRVNGWAIIAHRLSRSHARVVVRETTTPSEKSRHLRTPKQRLEQLFYRYLYPKADAVVVPSKGVYKDIIGKFPQLIYKVRVIYNPVIDENLYLQSQQPVSHPWFEQKADPVTLAVGRLIWDKGFDVLIRAFYQVRKVRNTRLVILGEGEQRGYLESLVQEYGLHEFVWMPGFEPNPFKYMRRADVFVLSSRREGLPNALIQAMACGCPVVSTDCPSGPDEILDGGEYGELVPVDNVEALAEAIIRVLQGNRKHVPKEWLTQFEVECVAEQYLHLLLGE